MSDPAPPASGFRSGFVTIVGRPNVGKSTLCNRLVGRKVAITSSRPQTTRNRIHGVRATPKSQIVLVDTPGVHRPRTTLGERCNDATMAAMREVDAVCWVLDGSAGVGPGDRFVAEAVVGAGRPAVVVVNKCDRAGPGRIARALDTAAGILSDALAFVPVSARTGEGLDALAGELELLLPEGPKYYPDGMVTDQPEQFLAAELVREKLLERTRDELPHSITVTIEEFDADHDVVHVRAVIHVERESQKGIVIGAGGANLKAAGTAARREMEGLFGTKVFLETVVRVERDWQRRDDSLDRLGF